MPTQKQLWLLAGGNGAGKSTFYRLYLQPHGIHFINADIIAAQIDPQSPEQVSYQAALLAEQLRNDLLDQNISFCFETVFSHPSKIDFLAKAKAKGYQIIIVYIHLENDDLNQARVKQRVSEGGHDVPADKIISRIPRTIKNIRKALPLADVAYFLDNSSRRDPFIPIATIKNGVLQEKVRPLPDWAKKVLSKIKGVKFD